MGALTGQERLHSKTNQINHHRSCPERILTLKKPTTSTGGLQVMKKAKKVAFEKVGETKIRPGCSILLIVLRAYISILISGMRAYFVILSKVKCNRKFTLAVAVMASFPMVIRMDDSCDTRNIGMECRVKALDSGNPSNLCCQELSQMSESCVCELRKYAGNAAKVNLIMMQCNLSPNNDCWTTDHSPSPPATSASSTASSTASSSSSSTASSTAGSTGSSTANPRPASPTAPPPPEQKSGDSKLNIIVGVLSGISALIAIIMWILGVFTWLWTQCRAGWKYVTGQKQGPAANASMNDKLTENVDPEKTQNGESAAVEMAPSGQQKLQNLVKQAVEKMRCTQV